MHSEQRLQEKNERNSKDECNWGAPSERTPREKWTKSKERVYKELQVNELQEKSERNPKDECIRSSKWTNSKRKANEIQRRVYKELQVNELQEKSKRNPKDKCKELQVNELQEKS